MTIDFTALDDAGLTLRAILDLDALPADLLAQLRRHCDPARRYRQLILIGHAGTRLWDAVQASGIRSEDPIDEFSVRSVEQWLATHCAGHAREIIYPGPIPLGLQALGKIAGWHHASPFMVGINAVWGTWYAYRVVVLTDTALPPSPPLRGESPCERCAEHFCIASCPAGALNGGSLALERCVGYRRQAASRCHATCVARLACPVGSVHRYCGEQMRHSYSRSLNYIAPAESAIAPAGGGAAPLTNR